MKATTDFCNKVYKDKKNRSWKYISVDSKDAKNINHRNIVGDVFCKRKEECIDVVNFYDDSTSIKVYKYKEKIGYSNKVLGYIPCFNANDEEEIYVRIVVKARSKVLLPMLLLIALLVGGGFYVNYLLKLPPLDKRAIAYQMPGGAKHDDPNSIAIPGYSKLTMDANTGKVKTALVNPEGNPSYFKYVVKMSDTQEVLYKTDLIKPGTAVPEFTIEKKLEKGTYDIELQILTTSLEDHTVALNGGVVKSKLEVQ